MNALPTTLMLAPMTMATPVPTPGAPARDGSEPGFAQCLEQAVERDPVATDAAAGKAAKEAHAADETSAPDAADTTHRSTASHGTRRAANGTPDPRKAEEAGAATAALLAASETSATQAAGTLDASAEDLATPTKPDGVPELASLLPGWTPTPATPVAPTMPAGGSAEHSDNASTALAATTLAMQTGLPAEANAGTKALRADELGTSPTFTLPQPAPAVQSATAPQDAAALAQAHVAAPVDSPAFAPALATQVRWLVRDGLQHAQLSLNPAEMGPVTVQIVLDGREARIDFRADLALTRNAIESSLPVLAAALDESGLRLAGGGVHDGQASRHGQGAGQQGWNGATHGASTAFGDTGGGRDAAVPATTRVAAPTRGLVDLVA